MVFSLIYDLMGIHRPGDNDDDLSGDLEPVVEPAEETPFERAVTEALSKMDIQLDATSFGALAFALSYDQKRALMREVLDKLGRNMLDFSPDPDPEPIILSLKDCMFLTERVLYVCEVHVLTNRGFGAFSYNLLALREPS